MPLFPVSPNIQEPVSRKRTHEEFIEGSIQHATSEPTDSENIGEKPIGLPTSVVTHHPQLPPIPAITMESTPASSPVDLTDPGSTPSFEESPSPNKTPSCSPCVTKNTTSQLTQSQLTQSQLTQLRPTLPTPASASASATTSTQPAKRKLTVAEREKEHAEKRQKKEAEATEKAKKKAADEATKAAKAAEKEEKEAARLAKKAEYEVKKREREEKEAKKAEEKRKKEEQEAKARQKQEKQKNLLAGFVIRKPTTSSAKMSAEQAAKPAGPNTSPTSQTEPKQKDSEYERKFKPFFVKDDVKLAPRPFEMDEETKAAKSAILDEFIRGERGEFNPKPFNPTETFNLAFRQKRGKVVPSVRKIMEKVHGDPVEVALGMTAEKSESQIEKLTVNAQDQLNKIPMKYLSFYEDVRPPYFGTATAPMERQKLRTLSRRPTGRVLPLNYDYDSEAEWVEDEDGEDLDEDEDDEESNDGDGEMEDFLDDSEDHPTAGRPTFLGETEPVSTGLCFEDENGRNPLPSMNQYRMEFILDTQSPIDPFSTEYWPDTQGKKKARTAPDTLKVPALMPPPDAPGDSSKVASTSAASRSARAADAKDLVPAELLEEFKQAIISEELREFTKATIVEMLAKKFTSCTKAQVKSTLDRVAHRISVPGAKKTVKVWALLPEPAS
ncbi:chromatin assembly factor 1 subunit A-domain-containing protein [Annulohypoxylon bovei var. microspora]|nr:chromatin assembly factor 1 subunit A-domain-containing protein [Annulohypoxylon bovei var. microspora]